MISNRILAVASCFAFIACNGTNFGARNDSSDLDGTAAPENEICQVTALENEAPAIADAVTLDSPEVEEKNFADSRVCDSQ